MSMRASAARYAKALLDVAIKESDPEQAEQELAAFVDLVQQHPELQRALANPVVRPPTSEPWSSRSSIGCSRRRRSSKLLVLLANANAWRCCPICSTCTASVCWSTGSSAPRSHRGSRCRRARRALQQRLAATTGRTVTMTTKVDPSIIGGVVTRIGSTVYDGSVATQLAWVSGSSSDNGGR